MGVRTRMIGCSALVLVAIVLVGCRPSFQAGREGPFFAALWRGDLAGAEAELTAGSRAAWRADTEALIRAHGAIRPMAATGADNGGIPGFTDHSVLYRIAFADGYERCLWVKGTGASDLTLVNGGYVACSTVPAPSISYGTPRAPATPAVVP